MVKKFSMSQQYIYSRKEISIKQMPQQKGLTVRQNFPIYEYNKKVNLASRVPNSGRNI